MALALHAREVDPQMQWQETAWLGSRTARRALAIVLTEMMKEGVISTARAEEIAKHVLHGNALEQIGRAHV